MRLSEKESWKWCYSHFAFNSSQFLKILCQFPTSCKVLFSKQGLQYLNKTPHLHNCGQVHLHQDTGAVSSPISLVFAPGCGLSVKTTAVTQLKRLQQLVPRSFSEAHAGFWWKIPTTAVGVTFNISWVNTPWKLSSSFPSLPSLPWNTPQENQCVQLVTHLRARVLCMIIQRGLASSRSRTSTDLSKPKVFSQNRS